MSDGDVGSIFNVTFDDNTLYCPEGTYGLDRRREDEEVRCLCWNDRRVHLEVTFIDANENIFRGVVSSLCLSPGSLALSLILSITWYRFGTFPVLVVDFYTYTYRF